MTVRKPVYVAGWGHCSARGLDATTAATAMLAGQTGHDERQTGGQRYPYFRMPLPQSGSQTDSQISWLQRAEAAIQACVADMRQRLPDALWQQLPVFFASSSFQVGLFEAAQVQNDLPRGAGSFALQCMQWLGLPAVPQCFSHACTSSALACDAAASWLAQGRATHALVIATEYDNQLTANGFYSLGLLSPDACRPFAADRNGFVLGEAVAAVLLTTDACLAQAMAEPLCWRLSASASATDTYALTGPDPSGHPIAAVIQAALQQAGLAAADIGLVKLHAAGVGATDTAEAHALQHVFGAQKPSLLSLKPYLGHTLGASTLAEVTALLACLNHGHIPATPGCAVPDPELGLVPVGSRQPLQPEHVLCISVGFGGSVAAGVLSRGLA